MGNFLLLFVLGTVSKCNGHYHIGDILPPAEKQLQAPLGFAQSILGGIAGAFGLNPGGNAGSHPAPQNNPHNHAGNPDTGSEESNENYGPMDYYHGQQQPYHGHHHHHHRPPPRPPPPPHRPNGYGDGYGNHAQYGQGYPNYHENNNPNQNQHFNGPGHKPGRPDYHQGNHHNNYGPQHPNFQNPQNKPGHGNNFNTNNGHPANQHHGYYGPGHNHFNNDQGSYETPGYGNDDQFNQNNVNQGFHSNDQYPSTSENPNPNKPLEIPTRPPPFPINPDKSTEEPKEDRPTFGHLKPEDNKKESATEGATDYDIDSIDIRFKEE